MKDCLGRELKIGDGIITSEFRSDKLLIGKVIEFTEKTALVRLHHAGGDELNFWQAYRLPHQLLLYGSGDRVVFTGSEIRDYLTKLIEEYHNLGDRKFELANTQVYNHVRKELDDLEDAILDRIENLDREPDGDKYKPEIKKAVPHKKKAKTTE